MKRIADTGLLKSLLDSDDEQHRWGVEQFQIHAPFYTCEAVMVELAFLLGTAIPGMKLVLRGDVILDFDLATEAEAVLDLLLRYRDRRMDLADACLVRMSERSAQDRIWTVDRTDFSVYRRHGRQPVPCEFPPEK